MNDRSNGPATPSPESAALLGRLRKGASVVLLRGSASVAQFGLAVVLGRILGPEGLGEYNLFASWTQIAGVVLALGLPIHVLRMAAVARDEAEERRVVRSALGRIAVASVVAVLAVVGLLALGAGWLEPEYRRLLFATSVAGAGLALLRMLAESLKARGQPGLGLAFEFNLVPVVILLGVAGWAAAGRLESASGAIVLHVAGLAFAAALAFGAWSRAGPKRAFGASIRARPAATSGGHVLLWLQTLQNAFFVQLPFVVAPLLTDLDAIGRFSAAFRLVALASTLLGAFAAVFAPLFARHVAQGDRDGLARSLRLSQIASIATYAPFFIAFVALPGPILSLFGDGFAGSAHLLWILALGQGVNAATGLVGYLLNMAHQERFLIAATFVGMVVLVVLAGFLPFDGPTRLAVAYSTALAVRNLLSLGFARRVVARLAPG